MALSGRDIHVVRVTRQHTKLLGEKKGCELNNGVTCQHTSGDEKAVGALLSKGDPCPGWTWEQNY